MRWEMSKGTFFTFVFIVGLYFIEEPLRDLIKRHQAEILQLEIFALSIIVFTFCINDK